MNNDKNIYGERQNCGENFCGRIVNGFYDISPHHRLYITEKDGYITYIRLTPPKNAENFSNSPLIDRARHEIRAFLDGDLKKFSFPFMISGTPFQLEVYEKLLDIPYGETRSYADIAAELGGKGYSRAVGNANNKNPLIFVVPCHRVICSNGSIGGYAFGTDMKKRLIETERAHKYDRKASDLG
ncbi:MAG: methylated-DNA--[protein]-cysteine S-methyltransferase [Oscillospiraceae bacterium]|nr:methylated-DNA--[protein]-cysteine S-methyltransferase [Oscillospiraceae bacterium]